MNSSTSTDPRMEQPVQAQAGALGPHRPDDDGVDVTLIHWMLSLSPDERLDLLDQFATDILELRDGQTPI